MRLQVARLAILILYSSQRLAAAAQPAWTSDAGKTDGVATASEQTACSGGSSTDLPYKYVGNSWSGKFHRPSCPFARAMDARHVILFHFRKEAVEAGHVPCHYCLPPDWKTVAAKLLQGSQKILEDSGRTGSKEGGAVRHQARE